MHSTQQDLLIDHGGSPFYFHKLGTSEMKNTPTHKQNNNNINNKPTKASSDLFCLEGLGAGKESWRITKALS